MTSVVFNGQVVQPRKVVCVGKNYAAHIEEMASVPAENMVVFMKPATSIGNELFAELDEPLHYEGEICLLCLLYTSPSPRDVEESRMPSSA